jgi:Immunoglobulin-like domain of bacterial spore germination/Sporulation and spore germination
VLALVDRDQAVHTGPGPAGTGDTSATTSSSVTTATTAPTTGSTTVVTPPPVAPDVLWPSTAGEASADPHDVAERFVRGYLGFDQAIVGEESGGEVPVLSANEGGATDRVVSKVSVIEYQGKWYVTGAHSDSVLVDQPSAFDAATSPVTVSGKGRGFEAVLVASVLDADGASLGEAQAMGGCCETLESYSVDVSFGAPAGATGAVLVHNTTGADFQTPEFTVVPVRFGASAASTTVSVFFTDGNGSVAGFTRTVPKTVGVLKAALAQELAGPAAADGAVTSVFSGATAGVPVSVSISPAGAAVVDFDPSLQANAPNASASAASAQMVAELNATVFQFPSVQSVEYRIGGSCDAFWTWLQGACHVVPRP